LKSPHALLQSTETTMNHSLFTCDRSTHIRIVAVALVACIVLVVASIHAFIRDTSGPNATAAIKPAKPTVHSTRDAPAIR
jgi:hypothetical protein